MLIAHRFGARLAGVGLVGCLLLAWCWLGGCATADADGSSDLAPPEPGVVGESNGGGTDAPAAQVDLENKPLPRIPAGTIIGKAAPEGWSNFLMIAVPTLTEEDLRDAPKIASHYARMFKFTLLAKTERTAAGYRLSSVARGFAMDVRGREVIVESKRTFGGRVGMFGDRILAENEKHIDADLRQVAKTPTMLLFDAQAVMRRGGEHARMTMRHAVVLDPVTGKPYTFVWLLSKNRDGYALAEKEMQLIPEGTREARYLSVKRDKFVLGLPTPEAFALVRTPQGTPIKWTPELEKLAGTKELTTDQVLELERLLLATGRSAAK
ncbi:MAG: hypothetical protein U0797_18715 [Gemmataceae bacterium]